VEFTNPCISRVERLFKVTVEDLCRVWQN